METPKTTVGRHMTQANDFRAAYCTSHIPGIPKHNIYMAHNVFPVCLEYTEYKRNEVCIPHSQEENMVLLLRKPDWRVWNGVRQDNLVRFEPWSNCLGWPKPDVGKCQLSHLDKDSGGTYFTGQPWHHTMSTWKPPYSEPSVIKAFCWCLEIMSQGRESLCQPGLNGESRVNPAVLSEGRIGVKAGEASK